MEDEAGGEPTSSSRMIAGKCNGPCFPGKSSWLADGLDSTKAVLTSRRDIFQLVIDGFPFASGRVDHFIGTLRRTADP